MALWGVHGLCTPCVAEDLDVGGRRGRGRGRGCDVGGCLCAIVVVLVSVRDVVAHVLLDCAHDQGRGGWVVGDGNGKGTAEGGD